MEIFNQTHRAKCINNVVVRTQKMMLCCDSFEAFADENWNWNSLICMQNVRAQRKNELVWAEKANHNPAQSKVVLTGAPLLKRGASWLTGVEIVVRLNSENALVKRPQGIIIRQDTSSVQPIDFIDSRKPLPEFCPLPSRPNTRG